MNKKVILEARCLNGTMDMAVDNRGRLLPCCYCDVPGMTTDPEFSKLLEVSYLKDYDSVEEIMDTKQWKKFVKRLQRNEGFPECNKVCEKNKPELITSKSSFISENRVLGTYKT